jgi:hypothetical protein
MSILRWTLFSLFSFSFLLDHWASATPHPPWRQNVFRRYQYLTSAPIDRHVVTWRDQFAGALYLMIVLPVHPIFNVLLFSLCVCPSTPSVTLFLV